jgi:RNA polymerase sigma-70 factor (ECF subfamily)
MHGNPKEPDDGLLVSRVLSGDTEAFALLFDRYARLVRVIAWDAGHDWATVQDLTQECFLRAYRQLPRLRQPGQFRFWVTGIARQLVRETRRRRRLEPLADTNLTADPGAPGLDEQDETAHILGLVARLPEQERLAVSLFFLGERSVAETAGYLELSRSGTYEVLKRACARLRGWLGVCVTERRCPP